jgi:hypothetical protein
MRLRAIPFSVQDVVSSSLSLSGTKSKPAIVPGHRGSLHTELVFEQPAGHPLYRVVPFSLHPGIDSYAIIISQYCVSRLQFLVRLGLLFCRLFLRVYITETGLTHGIATREM